uniref:RNA-directed DNA polymerase, eukaryota, reverse transcriptase zinc-binding domain protein n=1 Tax=Tanacetum cinerariifolium TaxID=118510 RepID=A0A699KLB6_TANCI|nr:RNA-directed DNA polymerase, eukaryota, reverse transcriptase zinc-binding domain protein [Tanacetum cinerariifolium]
MFKGISVSSSLQLSHLFYTDDVIFMGQWFESNINTIIQALDCFHKALGLRMNLQKSKLMGISVKNDIVSRAAIKMGCSTLKAPFIYLGVKVGGSMARVRFGVFMLIEVPCGLDLFVPCMVGNGIETSFWEEKWRGDMSFKEKYLRVFALESDKKISVSNKMHHIDIGFSLRRIPRDGVEMEQLNALKLFLAGTTLSNSNDRRSWSLARSGEFSVASVRKHIDDLRLGGSPQKTRWISRVPIKINILAWKVRYDFLPTRLNLSRRGKLFCGWIFLLKSLFRMNVGWSGFLRNTLQQTDKPEEYFRGCDSRWANFSMDR